MRSCKSCPSTSTTASSQITTPRCWPMFNAPAVSEVRTTSLSRPPPAPPTALSSPPTNEPASKNSPKSAHALSPSDSVYEGDPSAVVPAGLASLGSDRKKGGMCQRPAFLVAYAEAAGAVVDVGDRIDESSWSAPPWSRAARPDRGTHLTVGLLRPTEDPERSGCRPDRDRGARSPGRCGAGPAPGHGRSSWPHLPGAPSWR